jgi:hypothetical protein
MKAVARWLLASALAGPVLVASGPALARPQFSFGTGIEYSSGSYGQPTQTTVVSVPFSASVASGDWTARASIPFLSISGPANVSENIDGGGGASNGSSGRTGTETGVGDTNVSLTRSFRHIHGSHVYVDVTGRVRLPTGDADRGLGVGATDYVLNSEIGVVNTNNGAYLYLGRRFLGERDGGPDRVDGFQAGLGAWMQTGPRTRIGLSYSWRDPSVESLDPPKELGGFISYRLNPEVRISLDGSAGLSDASPDYNIGIHVSFRPTDHRR